MAEASDLDELVAYVARSSRLDPSQARRIVEDVIAFLGETPEQFVRRRHSELRRLGHGNDAIYPQIAAELTTRRFTAPSYTLRQIRRIIYG